jgi:hypothetical protein
MTTEYEAKVVKILDALHEHEEEDNLHTLQLLLQDAEEGYVFKVVLEEKNVRELVGARDPLTSKQMIELAIMLRSREEPVKMMVPTDSKEISLEDLQETKKLDPPKRNRNRRRRRNNKKPSNFNNAKRKDS